ncbi:protein adenylyltransferase SelO [Paenibacillus paeoniae]|uniref:Protein nucleotidyltransferase YdiU n=1 Tax=Paenibacillus paeoniae TaxID=2292705 RepID=A0A371P7H6_9BACL|nr:YdiU family protein [Paenibacillus paeoniae]REK71893.1 YdiU family protein [Paenibacillus paeoniae]
MTDQNTNIDAGWKFDHSYASLPELFYSKINPNPVPAPDLVILNTSLAASLGLKTEALKSERGVAVFAGNEMPAGALPLAQAYAGHQFAYFTMLGDGRALLIGEHLTPAGERVDIQLKGSGRTPYSRGGDGKASLGPMLREYMISEAMHGLGIPTTRSLAVVTTGQSIYREMELPGAILTRVAASHIRVGTFQYAAQQGSVEDLRALADYTWNRHYAEADPGDNRYLALLKEVIKRQGELIAKWQLAGFIHGVMNTDNMTLSGETIDYGPCAFMDAYNPATVFSSIDREGRYAYGNQPNIAAWNLARLAEALLPLLHEEEEKAVELAEDAIQGFIDVFYSHWLNGMRAKLGLFHPEPEDEGLIKTLLDLMTEHHADYTNTFKALTFGKLEDVAMSGRDDFRQWHGHWQERLGRQTKSAEDAHQLMRASNPAVIPRNHRVEAALEAAVERGDLSVLEKLLTVLRNPYAHTVEQDEYAAPAEPTTYPYRTFCGT